MRTPSRFMFTQSEPTPLMQAFGWAICLLVYSIVLTVAVALLAAVWHWWPPALLMFVAALPFALYGTHRQTQHRRRQLAQQAQARQGESICQFARSFNPRQVDTWVIRAVYNNTQQWLNHDCPAFPLRATDSLEKTLFLVDEDLDEMAQDIVECCGRTLDNVQENPFMPVRTVGDLVQMLNAQPMTEQRKQKFLLA